MLPSVNGIAPFTAVTGGQLLFPRILIDSASSSQHQHEFIRELTRRMTEIDFRQLSEGSQHAIRREYIPPELDRCSHVWLRVDRVRRPLEAPYSGSFKVLQRMAKTFRIELHNGKSDCVSIDRLKPAFVRVESDGSGGLCQESTSPTPQRTIPKSQAPDDRSSSASTTSAAERGVISDPTPRSTSSGRRVQFKRKPDYHYF